MTPNTRPRLSEQITVRCTREEPLALRLAAEKADLTLTEHIRTLVFGHRRPQLLCEGTTIQ
jgi:hypothetical protein